MKTLTTALCLLVVMSSASAFACGFEGSVTRGNSKSNDGPIATTWNGASTYPKNGWYTLDAGSNACGENVEIYVHGCFMGRYRLPESGNLRYDVHFEGQKDDPVGCRR